MTKRKKKRTCVLVPRHVTLRGSPILSAEEKCFALATSLFPGSEDGEGHCWDILNRILDGNVPDDWVARMRKKFGDPTPIAIYDRVEAHA